MAKTSPRSDPADPAAEIRVPILMYHRIGTPQGQWPKLYVPPDEFDREMHALATAGVRTVDLDAVWNAVSLNQPIQHALVITFDDATADQYTNAFPILKRWKIHATLYVPTALVGAPGYMTWEQIKEMVASGLISVGAHTVHHADLTAIGAAQAWTEISASRSELERRLGRRVLDFAYPYGHVNQEVERLVAAAGFRSAVTTNYGTKLSVAKALRWPRVRIQQGWTPGAIARLAE